MIETVLGRQKAFNKSRFFSGLPFLQLEDEGWTRLTSEVLDRTFGGYVFLASDYLGSRGFTSKVLKSFPS